MPTNKPLEKSIENVLRKAVEDAGGLCLKWTCPGHRGVPDRMILFPGGIIAFVTSKGTMDKQSPDVRRFIAQRAELIGAIRLPNNAFARNANTEVTSDILFLQKRDRPITLEPDWVHMGQTGDGIPVNSYFAEHPEMILGRMAWDDSMYGGRKETACDRKTVV